MAVISRTFASTAQPPKPAYGRGRAIRMVYEARYARYGFDGVYDELVDKHGYKRSSGGLHHAMKRMGLLRQNKTRKKGRRSQRCDPVTLPGEKIQIDVKEVPYACLRGAALRNGKHLYQWTAIDECTRWRFVFGYEEHTPENSVDFLRRLRAAFPFEIQTIQTDNGTEFTYRFISDTEKCPFETKLCELGITHKLIKPRTPWHNGKVERSHRNDQRYFYEHETFRNVTELNEKLIDHLLWSNHKRMRVLDRKSPKQKLMDFIWVA